MKLATQLICLASLVLGACSPDGKVVEISPEYVDSYVNGYNQGLIANYHMGFLGDGPLGLGKPMEYDAATASNTQLAMIKTAEKEDRQITEPEDKIIYLMQDSFAEYLGDDFYPGAFREGVSDFVAGKLPAHFVDFDPKLAPIMYGFKKSVEDVLDDHRTGTIPSAVKDQAALWAKAGGISMEQGYYLMVLAQSHKLETGQDVLANPLDR